MEDSPPCLAWRVPTWSSLVHDLNATFGLDFRQLNLEICKLQIPAMESEFLWRFGEKIARRRRKKLEKREKNLVLLYFDPSQSQHEKWLILIGWFVMTHKHEVAPLGCHLWVSHALNCCTILRTIAPVSGSQLYPASGVPFSKYRQTIYQNAQNYILIIV